MEKLAKIPYLPQGEELHVRIPVHYIIEKESENAISLHCSIRLEEDERPLWLRTEGFTLRKTYMPGNPGVTATHYSDLRLQTVDENLFVQAVDNHVRLWDAEYNDWAGHVH